MQNVKKNNKLNRVEEIYAWIFILPLVALLLAFVLLPLCASFVMSFMRWNIVAPPKFIGFNNFVELFNDKLFIKSIGNTFYLMIGIPVGMIFSFLLAVALREKTKANVFFRVLLYLPAVTNGVAVAVVWKWAFNQEYGMVNQIIKIFGANGINWLGEPKWIKPAFILMGIWGGLGSTMLLFLAGLNNIDQSLYEAADIFGATGWDKMIKISVPLISPVTFYILVMGIIGGLQSFGQTYVMTPGGGIDYSATTMVYYIWQQGIEGQRMGFASSAAWVLAIMIFSITFIQFIVKKKWVEDIE